MCLKSIISALVDIVSVMGEWLKKDCQGMGDVGNFVNLFAEKNPKGREGESA